MALTDKLTAIGVAIREKTGKSDLLTLDQMPLEIASITTGGGGGDLPEEAFNVTGNCDYKFAYSGWSWFINEYGNRISTSNITSASNMFRNNQGITRVPFTVNLNNCEKLDYLFYNDGMLEECPKVRGTVKWSTSTTFDSAVKYISRLTDFEDFFTSEMMAGYSSLVIKSSYSCPKVPVFDSCNWMLEVPSWLYALRLNEDSTAFPTYHIYDSLFSNCYGLGEVRDLPVWKCQAAQTSDMLNRTARNTRRLKAFTFETNGDGTPITANWKSQTLDLTYNVGYHTSSFATDFIPASKFVTDDASYQELKNDPLWYTSDIAYSRYNHDSAVETINSLPDTSAYLATAGGTNTVKFKGVSGSKTDGGAINTLTEEEIAVAAAKGWTVTFS